MKNFLLGIVFLLVLLPQLSFGADQAPALVAFDNQEGVKVKAFFDGQAAERDAFGKAHADVLARHDKHFKESLDLDMAKRTGKSTAGLPTPSDEDPAFAAFVQKQQSDKDAFFAKIGQEKQAFLKANPGIQ